MRTDPRPPWQWDIVLEDNDLVAVVKPAGLPTANAPRGRSSLHQILTERRGSRSFVGIVSRLDAPVSGLVVVAKTPAAAAALAQQFRDRTVQKRYLAVVAGRFPAPLEQWVDWHDEISRGEGHRCSTIVPQGMSPAPQRNIPPPRGRRPEQGGAGGAGPRRPETRRGTPISPLVQAAHTRARVIARAGEVSLVELEPVTGRRHQLRAQLAARGCPIVGDRPYGSRLPYREPGGIALHAAELELTHPADGRRVRLAAPIPAAWRASFGTLLGKA